MKWQKKLISGSLLLAVALSAPLVVRADVQPPELDCPVILSNATDPIAMSVCKIYRVGILAVWILLAVAFGYFVLGVVKYITAAGGEDAADAKQVMLYGLLGIAVIYGAWAFITFGAQYFLGIDVGGGPWGYI